MSRVVVVVWIHALDYVSLCRKVMVRDVYRHVSCSSSSVHAEGCVVDSLFFLRTV